MAKSGKKVSATKVKSARGRVATPKTTPLKGTPPKGAGKKQAKRPAWSDPAKPAPKKKPTMGPDDVGRPKPDVLPDENLTVAPGKPVKQNIRRVRPDNPTTDKDADNQPDEARSVMQGGSDVNDDDDKTSLDDVEDETSEVVDDELGDSDDDMNDEDD